MYMISFFFSPPLVEGICHEQCSFAIDTSIDQFKRTARVSRESGMDFLFSLFRTNVMKYVESKM